MMKRKLLSLSLAACLMIAPAAEFPGSVVHDFEMVSYAQETEQFQYDVLSDGTVAVTGYTGGESSVVVPAAIDGRNVSQIADNAFAYNAVLESVTIPGTVHSIGKSAFSHCCKLAWVDMPDSVTEIGACAFESCISLTEAVLPESVTTLGHSAYKNCVSLRQAVIPNSLKQLSSNTFECCSGLEFVTLPEGIKGIGSYAFAQCGSLTNIKLPDGVEAVGEYAFYKCSRLEKAELPQTVRSFGFGVFMYCEKLTEVNIPSSLTAMSNYLFACCSSLKNITIPNTITSIGYCAFMNCSSLESIVIPPCVSSISGRTFENCFSLSEVSIPEGVRSILERAFDNCTSLTSVNIPDSVTMISKWAFSGCKNLADVNIGLGTETIGSYAFYNCPSLGSITIPEYVTAVGAKALGYCYDHGAETAGDITIRCADGSAAHEYSKANSLNTELIRADDITRICGAARYETSMMTADRLKAENGGQPFTSIIIASGTNYADALSASYLAYVKDAPILITSNHASVMDSVAEYIKNNAGEDCQIYIIGGEAAVSEEMADRLSDLNVERIFGKNRYSTNLEVLRAAGVSGEDILVASGANYADALSASAVGKPILLVPSNAKSLTAEQEAFVKDLCSDSDTLPSAYIIGGTAAVSEDIETQLGTIFAQTTRVYGSNRFDTSLQVAETFFDKSSVDTIVAAYGLNYPDGLCAGPLAAKLGSPMLLVTDNNITNARTFIVGSGVSKIIALGGPALISDLSLKRISNAGKTV